MAEPQPLEEQQLVQQVLEVAGVAQDDLGVFLDVLGIADDAHLHEFRVPPHHRQRGAQFVGDVAQHVVPRFQRLLQGGIGALQVFVQPYPLQRGGGQAGEDGHHLLFRCRGAVGALPVAADVAEDAVAVHQGGQGEGAVAAALGPAA